MREPTPIIIKRGATRPSQPQQRLRHFAAIGLLNFYVTSQNGDNNYEPIEADQSFYLGTIPLPAITTQPVGQSVYPGDRVGFTVAAANGPLNYQWQFFGADIPGGTTPTLVLARVQVAQAGPYRVIVSNPAGSVSSAVANLTVMVSQGTARIVQQPQGQSIRVGESAKLSVLATGDGPLSYQWYRGQRGDMSGVIPGATNSIYTTSGLTQSTSFWVSARNSLGAVDSATVTVTVAPATAARLTLRRVSGLPGLVIDGVAGTTYRIEYTTDLSVGSWTRLTDLSLANSPFTFIDSGGLDGKSRFYRVLVP